MAFNPCAVIPSHDHYRVLGDTVATLRAAGLPVFIVDDGSAQPAREAIAGLHAPKKGVTVLRLTRQCGKGGAVIAGFRMAAEAGFSHALQIDADGQHDLDAIPRFLVMGAEHPDALILGLPHYDRSAPLGRVIGRWVTHLWVCAETLSPRIIDTMCGFRLYPLAATMALIDEQPLGHGMEFDTEIAVRLIWRKVPTLPLAVAVVYPEDNHSNFRLFADNCRISWMHTRLVTRLLLRPFWPARKDGAQPWFVLAERGGYWGLQFLALLYRITGRRGCMVAALPVGFCFYLSGGEQRRASREYLQRAYAMRGEQRAPNQLDLMRHTCAFVGKTVESFGAWVSGVDARTIDSPDRAKIAQAFESPRGAVLIVSHLGNIDMTRAVMKPRDRDRITVLHHTRHARNFERLLRRWRPEVFANALQVDETNPGTIIALREKVEVGNWIAIAGDRVPVTGSQRVSHASFLGAPAPFPQGPYILAHLLECPVYLMFCLREHGRYRIFFEQFAERIELPRRDKEAALAQWVEHYARRLEAYSLRAPLQWYNFFDFWAIPSGDAAQ